MAYNFEALFPGMEAIRFQENSQLGRDLESIFQDVLDYKESIDYGKRETTDDAKRLFKIEQVYNYAVKNLVPNFKDVLEQDIGLTCKKIRIVGGNANGLTGAMAVVVDLSGMSSGFDTNISKAVGKPIVAPESDKQKEAAALFGELADCIDLETSRVTEKQLSDGRIITIPCVYMDVNTMFLMEEFVPASVAEPLTAKEMAAIYLHEIGHVMTIMEHAADIYVVTERIKKFAGNKRNFETLDEIDTYINYIDKKVIPKLKQRVKTMKLDGVLTTEIVIILNSLLNLLSAILAGIRLLTRGASSGVNFSYNVVSLLLVPLNLACSLIGTTVAGIFLILTNAATLCFASNYYDESTKTYKSSDRKNTRNNSFLLERWADEFAIRHGYGDALISALDKIRGAFDYSNIVSGRSSFIAHSSFLWGIMSLFIWASSKYGNIVGKICKTPTYEDDYYRARRILQGMKQRFKEENIPELQCDALLTQLETAEKKVASMKAVENTTIIEMLGNIFDNIVDPITWIEMLKDGKMNRDFAILQNKLDDISSNKLYSLSYKMMNLGA